MDAITILGKMRELLGRKRTWVVNDYVTVKATGPVNVSIRSKPRGVIKIDFQEPKPRVKISGFFTIDQELDGFTITGSVVKVHVANLPEFAEPSYDLQKLKGEIGK